MKSKPRTPREFANLCRSMILKGWMPCGNVGQMLFKKNGKVYDLSAADLRKLRAIERDGLFRHNPHPS